MVLKSFYKIKKNLCYKKNLYIYNVKNFLTYPIWELLAD